MAPKTQTVFVSRLKISACFDVSTSRARWEHSGQSTSSNIRIWVLHKNQVCSIRAFGDTNGGKTSLFSCFHFDLHTALDPQNATVYCSGGGTIIFIHDHNRFVSQLQYNTTLHIPLSSLAAQRTHKQLLRLIKQARNGKAGSIGARTATLIHGQSIWWSSGSLLATLPPAPPPTPSTLRIFFNFSGRKCRKKHPTQICDA